MNPIFSELSGETIIHIYWTSRGDSILMMSSGVRLVWVTSVGRRWGTCCAECDALICLATFARLKF